MTELFESHKSGARSHVNSYNIFFCIRWSLIIAGFTVLCSSASHTIHIALTLIDVIAFHSACAVGLYGTLFIFAFCGSVYPDRHRFLQSWHWREFECNQMAPMRPELTSPSLIHIEEDCIYLSSDSDSTLLGDVKSHSQTARKHSVSSEVLYDDDKVRDCPNIFPDPDRPPVVDTKMKRRQSLVDIYIDETQKVPDSEKTAEVDVSYPLLYNSPLSNSLQTKGSGLAHILWLKNFSRFAIC